MPLALDKVHEFQRIPGSAEVRLVRTQPYVRLTHAGEPPIFIQGGQCYYQSGAAVTERPAWLPDAVVQLSATVRQEVGLPEAGAASEPQPKPKPKPPKVAAEVETWTCAECGKTLPKRGRTFHVLHHARQAKRQAAALSDRPPEGSDA